MLHIALVIVSNGLLELDLRSPSFARSLDRSLGRSLDNRSVGRSVARSIGRSIAPSLGRSVARSLDRSVARPLNRSIARSIARPIDRSIARSLGRSFASKTPASVCVTPWYGIWTWRLPSPLIIGAVGVWLLLKTGLHDIFNRAKVCGKIQGISHEKRRETV